VRSLGTLPSLPDIFYKLTRIIEQPKSSAQDIGKVIERDPGLTARVLRLVNSALYAFPGKIDGIGRAIAMVGTEQVKNLALATSVISMFKRVPPGFITMRSFWSHSLATALAAREIGRLCGDRNLETLFVGGLLHDIGVLILLTHRSKQAVLAARLAKTNDISLSAAEHQVMGYDHAQAGGALLEAWNLPVGQRKVVAHHHDPQRATPSSVRLE